MTEATDLLADIDTRVELLAHRKTLNVILQYIDSKDSDNELRSLHTLNIEQNGQKNMTYLFREKG